MVFLVVDSSTGDLTHSQAPTHHKPLIKQALGRLGLLFAASASDHAAAHMSPQPLDSRQESARRAAVMVGNLVTKTVIWSHAESDDLCPPHGLPTPGSGYLTSHISAATLVHGRLAPSLVHLSMVHGYTWFWWTAGIFVVGAVFCGALLRRGPLTTADSPVATPVSGAVPTASENATAV
jgi:hypothetical protein